MSNRARHVSEAGCAWASTLSVGGRVACGVPVSPPTPPLWVGVGVGVAVWLGDGLADWLELGLGLAVWLGLGLGLDELSALVAEGSMTSIADHQLETHCT